MVHVRSFGNTFIHSRGGSRNSLKGGFWARILRRGGGLGSRSVGILYTDKQQKTTSEGGGKPPTPPPLDPLLHRDGRVTCTQKCYILTGGLVGVWSGAGTVAGDMYVGLHVHACMRSMKQYFLDSRLGLFLKSPTHAQSDTQTSYKNDIGPTKMKNIAIREL